VTWLSASSRPHPRDPGGYTPTWAEVADAVWLASIVGLDLGPPATPDRAETQLDPVRPVLPSAAPRSAAGPSTPSHVGELEPRPTPLAAEVARPMSEVVVDSGTRRLHRMIEKQVSVLPNAAEIVRALRPLHRKVSARGVDEVELDEEATAEQAVQDRLWVLQHRPVRERWLDLTLVIDANPSATLWRPTVAAFENLLGQLGTFRTIRRRLLDTTASGTPILRGGTRATPVRHPAEVVSTAGRRVVLVLTDGVHGGWRDGAFATVLAHWGRSMPTAVVHLLPQRLWRTGGLPVHRARLAPGGQLRANRRWTVSLPDDWLEPSSVVTGVVPIPVLELQPRWLGRWAQLLLGNKNTLVDATVLLADERVRPDRRDSVQVTTPNGPPLSARERVRNFRHIASPAAVRLATLLSAVPVTVPVARVVQAEFVPEAGIEHIAEVLSSGLFEPPERSRSWESVPFHVQTGVREELLSGLRRSETGQVVRVVFGLFGDQFSGMRHMHQAINDPERTPAPDTSVASVNDIAIERVVLRALGGPYLPRAERLVEPASDRVDPVRASSSRPTTSVGGDMANTAEQTEPNVLGDSGSAPVAPAAAAATPDEPMVPVQAPPPAALADRRTDDAPPIWGNVPPRNPNFTGRTALLNALEQGLSAGAPTAVLPVTLHGMGGIGKTQIAVEYVCRQMHDYDVVWWIQASNAVQIRAGLTELAHALGLPGAAESSTAIPAVLEALRRGRPYRRWLLVFDSAESPETVRPFFPPNGPGQVLITSRNPDWISMASPLEVTTFEREESIELLERRGPEIDAGDADQLADVLGDLPLALEQAAAWRAETGMPVAEYLRLFDEKVAEILDTSAPLDYQVSAAAAWNVSFDELRTRSPAAHQVLQVCAYFSPEPISRQLFTASRGVSIAPELDMALRDPMYLSRAIRDINRYGLAKIDHRNNTLQLHRLVQLVLRNRMQPERQRQMRHGAHLLLANRDPNDAVSSQNWQRYRDILPHAYASQLIDCGDSWGRQLVLNLMRFLYQWGDHDEAIRLAETTLTNWTGRLGENDPQRLQVAAQLGFYYWIVGRYAEAADINNRIWIIRRQTDGENNEATLEARSIVGADRRAHGNFPGALELSAELHRKAQDLFGDDDPTTLSLARRHAIDLRVNGRYREAAELDDDVYRRATEILGRDHPETLSALSGLIMDRRESGEYLWARVEQEKLVERVKQVHGENNADTLRRIAYLAVGRRKAGDHQQAFELSKRTLERFRVRYGLETFNAMSCALAHSIDLRHVGDLRSSREMGEQVLARYQRNLGENHPYTLGAVVDHAVTLRLMGNPADARELNERALSQLRAAVGPEHAHAIMCAIDLASDLAALGDREQSLSLGNEALERAERTLGADHPTTLAASLNLVLDLRAVGRHEEAEHRYADVLARYRRALGAQHPATIKAGRGVRADCDIDPLPL
jgi:tetratricopeptide (TPR) repeat protein